jgi:hypothetical protein
MIQPWRTFLVVAVGFSLTLACSSSGNDLGGNGDGGAPGREGGGTGSDANRDGATPDGPFTEAPHAAFPQIPYQGGGLILAPQLVTVTFPGDPLAEDLVAFGQSIEQSSWWTTVVANDCESTGKNCITSGAASMSVAYPDPPASSYTDSANGGPSTLQTWLTNAIQSGTLPAPSAGPSSTKPPISNTLYLLYFPASTEIVLDGSGGCDNAEGYHNAMMYEGQQIAYSVISECPGAGMGVPPITTLQGTTITASHEIIESATDPSNIQFAYYLDLNDPSTWGWNDIEGGEVADMCVDVFGFDQDEWPEGDFTVQRIWSNSQAAKGIDPCAPITTKFVYFNATPQKSVFVMDVGATITLEIDAFSVAPRDNWTLTLQDWSDYPTNPYLTFTIVGGTQDKNLGDIISVNNGSKVEVKMTLTQDPGDNPNGEADGAVVSFVGEMTGAPANYFPFVVLSPSDAADAGLDASVSMGRHPRPHRVTRPKQRLADPNFGLRRRARRLPLVSP